MLKFITKETKSIVSAAFVVGVLSFASRIVGLIRDRILAGEFGAGDVLDIYYASFKIPDFLFQLLVIGAVSASFIPMFTRYYYGLKTENKEAAWRLTNNLITIIVTGMILLSFLILIFSNPISHFIAPGFSELKQDQVSLFIKIMLLSQIVLSISVIYGSVLQGVKRFFIYSLAPIFYNVGIIIGALVFVDYLGPQGLAWGVVFGSLLHLVVQYLGVKSLGYKYKWSFTIKDKDTMKVIKLMLPRVLGIGVSQIQILILTILASSLAVGSVVIFQFAYNIQFFPLGIIAIPFAIAAFPTFSQLIEEKDFEGFKSALSSTIRNTLFLIMPLMIIFLLLRAQIVRVVVGAGHFDWAATILTADTLAFFALGFIAQSVIFIISRAFFAFHDTVTPLVSGVISITIGTISAIILKQYFGVVGLGMGYTLSLIINICILWPVLRIKVGAFNESFITKSLLKMMLAGLIAVVVIQSMKSIVVDFFSLETFFGVLTQGLLSGCAGLMVYFCTAYLLKSPEIYDMIAGLKRRVLKSSRPAETLPTGDTTST
ncbi:MAG: murein biosynthesis integral membrane protein MurJ [Patescibacteria group bacterium]